MNVAKRVFAIVCSVAVVGCGPSSSELVLGSEAPVGAEERALAIAPAGRIPSGMPSRLAVGLFEDSGQPWMKNSAVKWDVRYRYLTFGWANNWGWGAADGSFALDYMRECAQQNTLPAFAYYEMNEQPGGWEGDFYQKTTNAQTMRSYFADFKLLMQRAKEFDQPVLVLLEADGFAYMQQQSGNDPNAYSAIADTGLPELAGIPNTAAGWGLAFLQLRKAVGANKVILGVHLSGWATGLDLFHASTSANLQAAVDEVYAFLAPSGLAANVTGQTYDVLVGDPLDRDANYYQLVRGENRWWDASDSAPIASKSFNRYAEWLRLWNLKSNKRWVLWQIPVGNSSSLDVCNGGGARQGYKDNRTEYFFGAAGAAHREKFAAAGVISLLFGQGEGCQASYENDLDATGQPYLKRTAGAFLAAGGLAIPAGPGGGTVDAGTPRVDAGTPRVDAGTPRVDAGTPRVDAGTPAGGDGSTYNFEAGPQGFTSNGDVRASLATSAVQAFAGTRSLAASFTPTRAGKVEVQVGNVSLRAGEQVTFHVWVPSGSSVSALQVFMQEGAATSWRWTAEWKPVSALTPNGWSSFTLTAPGAGVERLGVQFDVAGGAATTVYVDAIGDGSGTVQLPPPPPAPTPEPTPEPTPDPTPVPPPPPANPTPLGCLKVMPLGDSITLGVNGGYRNDLYASLKNKGCGVNFVGSQNDQYTLAADHDHEGHPGWTIADVSGAVNGWLSTYQPTQITLMVGTNDIAWWTAETGAQIGQRHSQLVDKIMAAAPNAWVIVATIPPITSQTIAPNNVDRAQLARDLNASIRASVAAKAAAGKKVRLAEVANVLSTGDLYDGVHPTQAAHSKVAKAFFDVLSPVTSCSTPVASCQ